MQRLAEDQLLVELVQGIRQRHPRMGGRKLYHELQSAMTALGIARGRDVFFDLLRERNLLVPVKRSHRRTTRSGLWRFENLVADLQVQRVDQVWVADVTYLCTEEGFVYLALLTDVFSRFIVGYDLSSSLAAEGCQRALNKAMRQAASDDLSGLIHHSDHGVQYTAWPYLDQLRNAGIRTSMGEVGNCYDNALAERVNGILKCEYGLDNLLRNSAHAHEVTRQSIWLYNFERPHLSLNYRKPADIYISK